MHNLVYNVFLIVLLVPLQTNVFTESSVLSQDVNHLMKYVTFYEVQGESSLGVKMKHSKRNTSVLNDFVQIPTTTEIMALTSQLKREVSGRLNEMLVRIVNNMEVRIEALG
ncbi:hypothetical protein NPIL_463341 [Nephila pilipes]|uniref:Uncharacterized protein n=1 Tax=Nephila pilipes TaxID=299642 RepID=A0A8X6NQL9_NEPPI|nr:hypothetical protein NPIL_463341 [Nephila pilipes]